MGIKKKKHKKGPLQAPRSVSNLHSPRHSPNHSPMNSSEMELSKNMSDIGSPISRSQDNGQHAQSERILYGFRKKDNVYPPSHSPIALNLPQQQNHHGVHPKRHSHFM